MMRIKNVITIEGKTQDLCISSSHDFEIEGSGLLALPALIDPHVHFRVPGNAEKEDWKSGALAAIRGGITRVMDMPNTNPPTTSISALREKQACIGTQLETARIPLKYGLYLGADKDHLEEIEQAKGVACAIKVFMGCSTGGLVVDDDAILEQIFQIASRCDMLVAVHAEDEAILAKNQKKYAGATDPAIHSKIRSREAATAATNKAINLAKKYGTSLYIVHLSTKEEVLLVRKAKQEGIPVFAEATPHHLFLDERNYATQKTLVQMNPPLRTLEDREALWEGIHDGTIDTIGTDHAPHLLHEKKRPFGEAPSGVPGVETMLSLLLNVVAKKQLTLEQLVKLTRTGPEKIFRLPTNEDYVLVDLNLEKAVEENELKTKCGWSPFTGMRLKGWPIFTILDGRLYPAAGAAVRLKKVAETQQKRAQENAHQEKHWQLKC